MGKNSKENKIKKKKRENANFLSTKASFVAGIVAITTIIKDIVEYCYEDIPMWVSIGITILSLILFFVFLGTNILDKYMHKRGVENYGTFLTVCSILIFAFENSLFMVGMDKALFLGICLIYSVIVIGALYLLFSRYDK